MPQSAIPVSVPLYACTLRTVAHIDVAARLAQTLRLREIDDSAAAVRVFRSQEVADLFGHLLVEHAQNDRENMLALVLDQRGMPTALSVLATGTIYSVTSSARELVKLAFATNGESVIIAHNHPYPIDPCMGHSVSREDRQLTGTFLFALRLVGLTLLDHVVIGHVEPGAAAIPYYSFLESGMLHEVARELRERTLGDLFADWNAAQTPEGDLTAVSVADVQSGPER